MNLPQPKIFPITSEKSLSILVARLQFGARKELVKTAPKYAKDMEELVERIKKDYLPNIREILDHPGNAVLMFPPTPGILISCVTSIDVFEGEAAAWHMSICRVGVGPPARAPDDIVKRICTRFFDGKYEEGPPEGVFKAVRHFRAPWRPS